MQTQTDLIRVDLRRQYEDWAQQPHGKMWWIKGIGGAGKATISWICVSWICASWFCDKGLAKQFVKALGEESDWLLVLDNLYECEKESQSITLLQPKGRGPGGSLLHQVFQTFDPAYNHLYNHNKYEKLWLVSLWRWLVGESLIDALNQSIKSLHSIQNWERKNEEFCSGFYFDLKPENILIEADSFWCEALFKWRATFGRQSRIFASDGNHLKTERRQSYFDPGHDLFDAKYFRIPDGGVLPNDGNFRTSFAKQLADPLSLSSREEDGADTTLTFESHTFKTKLSRGYDIWPLGCIITELVMRKTVCFGRTLTSTLLSNRLKRATIPIFILFARCTNAESPPEDNGTMQSSTSTLFAPGFFQDTLKELGKVGRIFESHLKC